MDVNFCAQTAGIWKLVGEVIYIIRIGIPIIVVLLGTLDLGKAVIAGEDKKIKEAQKAFIRRLIYGVAIFFVFTIVKMVFGLLNVDLDKGDNKICWQCASKPHARICNDAVEASKNTIINYDDVDTTDDSSTIDSDTSNSNYNNSSSSSSNSNSNTSNAKAADDM